MSGEPYQPSDSYGPPAPQPEPIPSPSLPPPEKGTSQIKIIVVAVIAIVVILAVLFVPFVPAKETYSEVEQYSKPAGYSVDRDEWDSGWSISKGCYCNIYIKVRNTDVRGGTFDVSVEIQDILTVVYSNSKSQYIGPGESYQFRFYYNTHCDTDYVWSYDVDPPSIIDERVVEKERTVYKSVVQLLTGG